MPHPPLYAGGQDDDRTRSIDLVHIEPSIREGLFLVSSLYGPGASAPVNRFPPTFAVQPFINGSNLIPATLICEPGKVVASPAAVFTYQWMRNGVDIAGATNQTYTTSLVDDGTTITCEVRAVNPFGEDYGLTNSLNVSLIEPVEIRDYKIAAISGREINQQIITHNEVHNVVTGVAALSRLDVQNQSLYLTTGISSILCQDINTMLIHTVTGLEAEGAITTYSMDGISVINFEDEQTFVEGVRVPVNLKNNDAELGLAGWTIDGSARWITGSLSNPSYEGDTYWEGGANVHSGGSNIPYTQVYQDVEMFEPWWVDIDAGTTNIEWSWYQSSLSNLDLANVKLAFLDINRNVISAVDPQSMWAGPQAGYWVQIDHEVPIPPNTRFIRFIQEYALISGTHANGRIDYIQGWIRKGAKPTFTDVGPTADKWRIRFTRANSYPGCSLSELEFRPISGGADAATGGTPLFGSEGNGGLAVYAFDDLRNTGYWAGEQSGVANGTAWIGYDFPVPIRPAELDVTLRSGNGALEFGRDFYVEMSDDGNNWYKVQFYRNWPIAAPLPTQQQIQIEVLPTGPFPVTRSLRPNMQYLRQTSNIDDFSTKGVVFRAKVRMEITHVSFGAIGSLVDWDGMIYIAKAAYQNGRWMIRSLQESVTFTIPNAGGVSVFHEFTLPNPVQYDVDEFFAIMVTDFDAATASISAGEGRIGFFNVNELVLSDGTTWRENKYTSRWGSIHRNDLIPSAGDFDEGVTYLDYAVDFRGNIL